MTKKQVPSWPRPLLGIVPIRLRPMGWLDDLLPLRPPSLWRGHTLHQQRNWSPHNAELSWLFDAYAMLGIELPPQHIQHRSHVSQRKSRRSPHMVHSRGLTRKRPPIKGGKQPLVIPKWAGEQPLRSPSKTNIEARVPQHRSLMRANPERFDSTGGLADAHRILGNLPQFQWKSPSGMQQAPLSEQPTILKPAKDDAADLLKKRPTVQNVDAPVRSNRIQPSSSPTTTLRSKKGAADPVLMPHHKPLVQKAPISKELVAGKPKVSSSEVQPLPPKITWQSEHQKSPWRIHRGEVGPAKSASVSDFVTKEETTSSQTSVQKSPISKQSPWRIRHTEPTQRLNIWQPSFSSTPTFLEGANAESLSPPSVTVNKQSSKENTAATVEKQSRKSSASPRARTGSTWRIQHSPKKEVATTPKEGLPINPLAPASLRWKTTQLASPPNPELKNIAKESIAEPSKVRKPQISSATIQERISRKVQDTFVAEQKVAKEGFSPESAPKDASSSPLSTHTTNTSKIKSLPKAIQIVNAPIINWKPSIQPVFWTMLRQGVVQEVQQGRPKNILKPPSLPTSQRITQSNTVLESPIVPKQVGMDEAENLKSPKATIQWGGEQRQAPSIQTDLIVPLLPANNEVEPVAKKSSPDVIAKKEKGISLPSRVPWRIQHQPRQAVFPQGKSQSMDPAPSKTSKIQPAVEQSTESITRSISNQSTRITGSQWRLQTRQAISWNTQSRSTLLRHFEEKLRQQPKPKEQSGIPVSQKVSTFLAPEIQSGQRSLKRGQSNIQIPMLSGSLVFPTPEILTESKNNSGISPSTSNATKIKEVDYPKGIVVGKSGYLRRIIEQRTITASISSIPADVGASSITKILQVATQNWQRKIIPFADVIESSDRISKEESRVVEEKAASQKNRFIRPEGVFWRGNFAAAPQQNAPTILTIPSELSVESSRTSGKVSNATIEAVPKKNSIVKTEVAQTLTGPKTVKESDIVSRKRRPNIPNLTANVNWKPNRIRLPIANPPKVAPSMEAQTLQSALGKKEAPNVAFSPSKPKVSPNRGAEELPSQQMTIQTTQDIPKVNWRPKSFPSFMESTPKNKLSNRVAEDNTKGKRQSNRNIVVPPSLSLPLEVLAPSESETDRPLKGREGQQTVQKTKTPTQEPTAAPSSLKARGAASVKSDLGVQKSRLKEASGNIPSVSWSNIRIPLPKIQKDQSVTTAQTSWVQPKTLSAFLGFQPQSKTNNAPLQLASTQSATSTLLTPSSANESVDNQRSSLPRSQESSTNAVRTSKGKIATEGQLEQKTAPTSDVILDSQKIEEATVLFENAIEKATQKANRNLQQVLRRNKFLLRSTAPLPTKIIKEVFGRTILPKALKSSKVQDLDAAVERQLQFFRSAGQQSFLQVKQIFEEVQSPQSNKSIRSSQSPTTVQKVRKVEQELQQALQKMVRITTAAQNILAVDESSTTAEVNIPRKSKQTSIPSFRNPTRRLTAPSLSTASTATVARKTIPPPPTDSLGITPNTPHLDYVEAPAKRAEEPVPPASTPPKTKSTYTPSGSRWRLPKGTGQIAAPPLAMLQTSSQDIGVFLKPPKPPEDAQENQRKIVTTPASMDSNSEIFMVDPSGNLLTGEAAKKRMEELGYARRSPVKTTPPAQQATSGSYTWNAPPEVLDEMMKETRQKLEKEERRVATPKRPQQKPSESVIKRMTEEQLISILIELATSSPEAQELLREVHLRVEEYFDYDRFRKI